MEEACFSDVYESRISTDRLITLWGNFSYLQPGFVFSCFSGLLFIAVLTAFFEMA